MKNFKCPLSRQLMMIIIVVFGIVFLFLGILLPKVLIPVAEKNLYNYLKEPLSFVEKNIDKNLSKTQIAYLYQFDNSVVYSENIDEIIKVKKVEDLLPFFKEKYGKFTYNYQDYYYYTLHSDDITKIAFTNDNYILQIKNDLLKAILPVLFISFASVAFILILWSGVIVKKIEKLKLKIDHIDDTHYEQNTDFYIDDEIKSLSYAIEDMRISLKNQEELRNQMYQNISHDFKTPLTVIKSYVEAYEDDVEDADSVLPVIKEQTEKLEQKVHSLLYLNKLDYLKDVKMDEKVLVDLPPIIEAEIKKFKFQRKEIKFLTSFDKTSKFYGTSEHFETILDNLLQNFMRYASTTIKITIKNNRLILYNDGANIDEDLLDGIFTPFRTGVKGEFGLGLSIVKKTLNLMNYDIQVKNEKKGVTFTIFRKPHKR